MRNRDARDPARKDDRIGLPPSGALVAVCGAPASGKSVFLTCIFRTVSQAISPNLSVTFDRKHSDASHFETIEKEIAATGKISGTERTKLKAARLLIEMQTPIPPFGKELPVEVRDFAGGHFSSYIDPNEAVDEEVENAAAAVYKEVERFLEQAHAVVILIDSARLKPDKDSRHASPFNLSVDYMIEHCRKNRIPIALLASQADRVPELTEEYFQSIPKVRDFLSKFTPDFAEFSRGGRPFGIARRVSCYTVDEKDLPKRITPDGGFWRKEPAEIVRDLLWAALSRIVALFEAQKEEELRATGLQRQAEEQGRRKRIAIVLGIFVAVAALAAGVFAYWNYLGNEKRATLIRGVAAEVSAGNPEALGSEPGQLSSELVAAVGDDPSSEQPRVVQEARGELDAAILGRARSLYEKPEFSAPYRDELDALLRVSGTRLAPLEPVWESTFAPHLSERSAFLAEWLSGASETTGVRLERVNQALGSASEQRDGFFSQALRETRLELWRTLIRGAGGGTVNRIKVIRELLPSARADEDEQSRLRNLSFLGAQVIWSLTDQGEGELINKVLTELRPNLSGLKEGRLRFEVVLSSLASCESGDECKVFMDRLQGVLGQLTAQVEERQPIVETTLQELLQGLPVGEKRRVWEEMLNGLEKSYLFTGDAPAWPEDLQPLPARARSALEKRPKEAARLLDEFLERVVWVSLYEGEVRYLLRGVQKTWARQRLVENCHLILSHLQRGSPSFGPHNFRIISESLLKEDDGRRFDWDARPRSSSALAAEAEEIYGRIESFRRTGWSARPELMDYLEIRLSAQCKALDGVRPETCSQYE